MKGLFGYSKGQMFVLYAVAATALLGAVALGTDVAIMYYNWASMQRAVDSAALAGASYLPDDTATATAKATSYATLNGVAAAELAAPTFNSPTNDTITVAAARTVPYYFGKVVGLTSQVVQVSASAQLPGGPGSGGVSCLNCASLGPTNQPAPCTSGCGTITPATAGSTLGQYELMPIGLDSRVAFQTTTPITLQQGRVSPGNWDFLSLGGSGGNVLRNNIDYGYTGVINVGQWIWTKTGQNVGPANQGFDDRIGGGATCSDAVPSPPDPRLVVFPIVNWALAGNGNSIIQVLGFAHMFLCQDIGHGQFQAKFITGQVPDSLVSSTTPPAGYHGARGNPVLIR